MASRPSARSPAGLLYRQKKKTSGSSNNDQRKSSVDSQASRGSGATVAAASHNGVDRSVDAGASGKRRKTAATVTDTKKDIVGDQFDIDEFLHGARRSEGQLMRVERSDESSSSESDSTSGESSSGDEEGDGDGDEEFGGFEDQVNGQSTRVRDEPKPTRLDGSNQVRSQQANGHTVQQEQQHSASRQHIVDRDSEEEELEALVFGDSAGFRASLSALSAQKRRVRSPSSWRRRQMAGQAGEAQESEEDDQGPAPDLGLVGDDDLFFVDAQGTDNPKIQTYEDAAATVADQAEEEDESGSAGEVAWEDSDDARIRVSLAGVSRLRKLRVTEDEDVISGKEYVRRLRRQYLKLNPRPQWVDDATQLQQRRNKRRRTSNGEEITDSSESDVDMIDADTFSGHRPLSDLLRDATSLTRQGQNLGKRKFRPEVIDIQRAKHIADKGPSAITTLQVHPHFPLLIASGPSSKMDLYHLHDNAPTYTTHLTSLWMRNHPFTTTVFHPLRTDPRIFLSARRRYFHVWNLSTGQIETVTRMYGHANEQRSMESFKIDPNGKYIAFIGSARKGGGVINFLDANTLQWIAQARIEGRGGIADFAWWRNGAGVVVAGKNGEITEWNLEQRRVVARWRDEGAVGTTTLALGGKSKLTKLIGGDAYIAIGSSAGIVNVYSRAQWFTASTTTTSSTSNTIITNGDADSITTTNPETSNDNHNNNGIPQNPTPLRALDQLTTPISHLTFAPGGQVLCMASRWKKDALRLVHLPSCTVYRNWPTSNTPLGRISAVCWGEINGGAGAGAGEDGKSGVAGAAEGVLLKLVVGNEAGRVAAWDVRGE